MKKLFASLLMGLPLFLSAQLISRSLTTSTGIFFGFYEFRPPNYGVDPTVKYPLIISLHGIYERGNGTTELYKVKGQGIPKNIDYGNKMTFTWNGKTESFLVLAPQCRKTDTLWYSYYIDEMINYAKKNLAVDTNRIILTGFSMGGGGVWMYPSASQANGSKLAAIAPICPACLMSNAKNIADAKLPVYAFHALNDTTSVALPSCTIRAIDSIRKYNPPTLPQYTYYPTGGHSIWSRAYDTAYIWQTPNIYEWMLNQDKSKTPNRIPIAITGNDTLIHTASGRTPLYGSSSYDSDGTIIFYKWKFLSGPATIKPANSTLANASISSLKISGFYKFELKVTDNRASISHDTITVEVNVSPVANAGADQTITLPMNSSTLNGSSSYDPDGSIVSYKWTRVSGSSTYIITNPNMVTTTVTGLVRGTYKFRLTVTDNKGGTKYDDMVLIVNAPPIARAGADSTLRLPKNTSTLIGSGSSDADGFATLKFLWEKISGPATFTIDSPTVANTKVLNLVEGTYGFRLTVTDNRGVSARDTTLRIVLPALAQARPVASSQNDLDIINSSGLRLYPSVTHGNTMMTLHSADRGRATVRIYDERGKEMKRLQLNKDQQTIQHLLTVENLASGIYYVEVRFGGKTRMVERLVRID